MNKKLFCVLASLVLTNICFGQDFQKEFNKYFEAKDTLKQREILAEWEKSNPKDPELFANYFNYFFMGSGIAHNEELLQQGMNKIDEGIALYPNRLDMRFEKIYVLGQIEDWQQFTDEIVKAIQYSKINNNQWTWIDNEKLSGEEDFFAMVFDNGISELFATEDKKLLLNARTIINEILKAYPEHEVECLRIIARTYAMEEQYDKSVEILLKVEKINPKEGIDLVNIADGYRMQGYKQKAIKYYKKLIKYREVIILQQAKQQIEKLKK